MKLPVNIGSISEDQIRSVLQFSIRLFFLYLCWRFFKVLVGIEIRTIDAAWPWLGAQWNSFYHVVRYILLHSGHLFLEILGYDCVLEGRYILKILGYRGVIVSNYCLAIHLMVTYSILIMSINQPIKVRLTALVVGLIGIQFLNTMRFVGLNLMTVYLPEYAELSHDLFFNSIVYVFTILMFIKVMNRKITG